MTLFQVIEEVKPKGPLKRSWIRIFEEASARDDGDDDEGQVLDLQHLKSGWQVLGTSISHIMLRLNSTCGAGSMEPARTWWHFALLLPCLGLDPQPKPVRADDTSFAGLID